MKKNALEKDIWAIIFKALSDKKISYAVSENTYPQKQIWTEHHSYTLPIMLEDPKRKPLPGNDVPWTCFLKLERNEKSKSFSLNINLEIYLPITADIKDVLSIIDDPYIGDHPSLILIDLPESGKHYCINIRNSHLPNPYIIMDGVEQWLSSRINAVNDIVIVLYKIEDDPKNKELIEELKYYLTEI